MSKRQDRLSYDPAIPSLTHPGGIQLSDWPAGIVNPEMIAKEAEWAKAGEKYTLKGPEPGDHYGRYLKTTRTGPAYKNPPYPHVAEDLEPRPKRARPKAANRPKPKPKPKGKAKPKVKRKPARKRNGGGGPDPTRENEKHKKQAPVKPAGVRSSTRLQQKAQAALELSGRNNAQDSALQSMPPPAAPLPLEESNMRLTFPNPASSLVRESAIRSTLHNVRPKPNLAQTPWLGIPAEPEFANHANVASADTENANTKSAVGSKSEPTNAHKAAVVNKASAVSTKAAAPTKKKTAVKPTAAGKTSASAKSGTKKKVAATPKIEGSPEPMTTQEAIPKTSGPSKASTSSAITNGSKKTMQGAVGNKRKAATNTSAAPVKRPRIGRACNPCREKKTRCDGNTPCEACDKRGFDCVYGDGQLKPNDGAQDPDNRPPGDDGGPGKTHKDKKQPTGSKSNTKVSNAFSTSSKTKETKRKREDEAAEKIAQSHPGKKMKIVKATLPNLAAKAKLRAQQKLDDDINKFMQERSPTTDAPTNKRKRLPSDEEAETRPAKLQRRTTYIFEVLEGAKLEAMQTLIIESLAQSASDFKPLQKIGHLVKRGKLSPQIIDINPQEEAFHNRPSIKLVLPDHIKGFLVDDWENVTKNNQLVHLPHPKPVEVILQDYLAAEKPNREEGSTQMDILEETIAGLREYFDRALGRILLYRYV